MRRPLAPANLDGITHLLMEDWQSVLGSDDLAADLPLLSAARIKHGVIVYGRVDRHQLRRRIRAYDGTVFVTDSAIAQAVTGARWLQPGGEGVKTLQAFLTDSGAAGVGA